MSQEKKSEGSMDDARMGRRRRTKSQQKKSKGWMDDTSKTKNHDLRAKRNNG